MNFGGLNMIDIDKKYRTRDGREVRIYATDGYGERPIHAACRLFGEDWFAYEWKENGMYLGYKEYFLDLIEIKPRIKQTLWINIYNTYQSISSTEKFAKNKADCGILARVKVDIDVEEGHGL